MYRFTPPTTPRSRIFTDKEGKQSQYLAAAEVECPIAPLLPALESMDAPPPLPRSVSAAGQGWPVEGYKATDGSSDSSLDPHASQRARKRSYSTPAADFQLNAATGKDHARKASEASDRAQVTREPQSTLGPAPPAPTMRPPPAPRVTRDTNFDDQEDRERPFAFAETKPSGGAMQMLDRDGAPKNASTASPRVRDSSRTPTTSHHEQELDEEDEKRDSVGQQLGGRASAGMRNGGQQTPMSSPHLPPLVENMLGLTAYANWDVANEIEWSMAKVVGPAAVDKVLSDPEAYASFRAFVAESQDAHAPLLLDLYKDLVAFSALTTSLRLSSSAISSTYLLKNSPARLALPISLRGPLLETLYRSADAGHTLFEPIQALHADVYEKFFQPWVQQKLVEQAVARLASWKTGAGWTGKEAGEGGGLNMAATDGLAESDPSLRDNPITLASEGFAALTGYPLKLIVGRNCRFLQGPGTSPESTQRLHDALAAGESVTALILNYRRDGTPFYNLLCMKPFKDAHGIVRHFIGGQIDVTGSISALVESPHASTFPLLPMGPTLSHPADSPATPTFTPSVQAHISRLTNVSSQTGILAGDAFRELGSVVTDSAAQPFIPPPSAASTPSATIKGRGAQKTFGFGRKSSSTLSIRKPCGGDSGSADGSGLERVTSDSESSVVGQGEGNGGGAKSSSKRSKKPSLGSKASLLESTGPFVKGLRAFEETYSRLALVNQSSGDIMYTTPELLIVAGLPAASHHELHGTSFVKIFEAPLQSPSSDERPIDERPKKGADDEKDATRRLRRNARLAIDSGHAYTALVGLKPEVKKLFGRSKHGESEVRNAVLHLVPLSSKNGDVEALLAVFG
ncbi:hypothetical protein Rhopal_005763-T1 [Rhodotorula paludigena]|uniref:PAS domain-containing protein n=1 Tax=Rhodotorula paludigena TaxID=86838 RepID=A0AAV5GTM8_9BASI|nr:hypothetical protein Rhopal_005763-T1 [Rhodotorula paludigena]